MICSHLFVLPHCRIAAVPRYRVTARHTYRTTEVQQNWPERALDAGKYRVTEIPNAVNTAGRKEVNTDISLAVYAAILLCFSTAIPRYRMTY